MKSVQYYRPPLKTISPLIVLDIIFVTINEYKLILLLHQERISMIIEYGFDQTSSMTVVNIFCCLMESKAIGIGVRYESLVNDATMIVQWVTVTFYS